MNKIRDIMKQKEELQAENDRLKESHKGMLVPYVEEIARLKGRVGKLSNSAQFRRVEMQQEQIIELQAKLKEYEKKYHELIMAVGNKCQDETRHETALRYIQQAEKDTDMIGKSKIDETIGGWDEGINRG